MGFGQLFDVIRYKTHNYIACTFIHLHSFLFYLTRSVSFHHLFTIIFSCSSRSTDPPRAPPMTIPPPPPAHTAASPTTYTPTFISNDVTTQTNPQTDDVRIVSRRRQILHLERDILGCLGQHLVLCDGQEGLEVLAVETDEPVLFGGSHHGLLILRKAN